MRAAAQTDFYVPVEGVGQFRFGKRMMRDEMRINVEYSRLTEGIETPTSYLDLVATWMSTLKVLTVEAPAGWDVDEMDPLDDDTYAKLMKVFTALREKEGSFRRSANKAVAQAGAANSEVAGVLVPPQVPAGAD